jgi:hypothetical protein
VVHAVASTEPSGASVESSTDGTAAAPTDVAATAVVQGEAGEVELVLRWEAVSEQEAGEKAREPERQEYRSPSEMRAEQAKSGAASGVDDGNDADDLGRPESAHVKWLPALERPASAKKAKVRPLSASEMVHNAAHNIADKVSDVAQSAADAAIRVADKVSEHAKGALTILLIVIALLPCILITPPPLYSRCGGRCSESC